MTKIQKRLVGLGCLALVAAITTVAYNIPDVSAESATGVVNINFRVLQNAPSAHFESPESGSETTDPNVSVVLTYSNAEQITYTITKKGKDGAADQTITLPPRAIDDTYEHRFSINLDELFGSETEKPYGTYILKATVSNSDRTPAEDSVELTYKAPADDDGKDDDGKDDDGKDDGKDDGGKDGGNKDDGNKGGDGKGAPTDSSDGPAVPNTGDFLSRLNISSVDFLITGLIGFTAVTILGFVLLKKKGNRN